MMFLARYSLVLLLSCCGFVGSHAVGAVVLLEEDFNPPVGSDPVGTDIFNEVASWGESDLGATDILILNTANGGSLGGEGASAGVSDFGYLYREVGTRGVFPTVTVSGVNFWRNNSQGQRSDLKVDLYSLPATDTFTFAENGNDIALAPAASLQGTLTVDEPLQINTTVPFTLSSDVSGIASDDRLFVRFSRASGTGFYAYVDNITVSAIPEPSSALVLSVIGFGAGLKRRRRS